MTNSKLGPFSLSGSPLGSPLGTSSSSSAKPNESARITRPRREELNLARSVLGGSEIALTEFSRYLAKIPSIVRLISEQCGLGVTGQEKPDVVQDCLIMIWRKLPDFRGDASLLTWMFRVCALEIRNSLRRLRKSNGETNRLSPRDLNEIIGNSTEPESRALGLDLQDGLNRLQEHEARVVRLKYFESLTLDEIAEKTSVRSSQARTVYYRAIRRLHDYLAHRSWGNDS